MVRLSDIRIGTKLTIISGLGILLVLAIVAVGMHGNSQVRGANDSAEVQQVLARDFIEAKAAVRGMQIGVRDLRLSNSRETLQRAMQYSEARYTSASTFIDKTLPKFLTQESRDRAQRVKTLVEQYWAGAKEIAAIKEQIVGLGADATSRIAELNQEVARIARERTLPLANEMEEYRKTYQGGLIAMPESKP